MSALVVFNPSESKRLIARAVRELPEVKEALKKGTIIIIGGTTNAFVAEELTGSCVDKFWFAAGRVAMGSLGENPVEKRIKPVVLRNGRVVDEHPRDAVKGFGPDDVYIKGANAVDSYGHAGVLMSSETGGSLGDAMGTLMARGSRLIVPVGLEKLVPSVIEASRKCGKGKFLHSMGSTVGMMPLVAARVITEISAIGVLFGEDVKATHIASGGVAGCEGAVVLTLEGDGAMVKKAFDYLSAIKGEKAVSP